MTVNKLLTPDLLRLRTLFQAQGFDLRFVGGCVRDTLLGLEPKDVDLHTDANPHEQVAIYQAAQVRYVETGLKHGTVTVVMNDVTYEITSLRQDVETDGRHATVAYTRDWHVDLERRDFTINAMSLGFDGDLMDPFQGLEHLKIGLVHFVGDAEKRVQEDYLRILRWFRFRGRFGMSMSYSARRAVEKLAQGLQNISRERVWSEVSRILAGDDGPLLMAQMQALGIHRWIDLPAVSANILEADEVHTLTRHPVTMMVALYGIDAANVLVRWRASTNECQMATWLNVYQGKSRRLQDLLAVDGVSREWVMELAALRLEDDMLRSMLAVWTVPVFPVSGHDVMALGCSGVEVGRRLKKLKDAWSQSDYALSAAELLDLPAASPVD